MREDNADMYFICAYNLEMDRKPTVFIATKDHPNYPEFEFIFNSEAWASSQKCTRAAKDLYTYDASSSGNGTVRVYRMDTDDELQANHEAWLDHIYADVE